MIQVARLSSPDRADRNPLRMLGCDLANVFDVVNRDEIERFTADVLDYARGHRMGGARVLLDL